MSRTRQTARQQEKVRTLVLDLIQRAIEITHNTKHDVNVNYSGHVNHLNVDIHVNGYRQGVGCLGVRRNPTAIEAEYNAFVVEGIYLDDNINEIIDFFKVANSEFDKLVAADKAA
ncbi:hypothetical protein L1D14_09280 [Vibrio tubiashii]|uniref:hypothetical protein n=1 Tax=Vibrio tubiashii TaxID=29498 RepID=UPI001EFE059B|nr:hypothetical protein [Vibrio tubiashii]MCG9576430.1 hypothetical protein [Vibrio tubiashii]